MKDSVVQITVFGIIGTVIINALIYALQVMGVNVLAPWLISANVFLEPELAQTTLGIIIGLVGTGGLGIASAAIILLLLHWTGKDYAILKGIVGINAFSFITMGLFMPLLNIAPQVRADPLTNIVALSVLSVAGAIVGALLQQYAEIK
ncbi:hypothetical protein [Dethiobacter alkaliphilus]|uniref:Uncharacterized protein n=1 Tax=Dethiobacter alkaliphilus AHT 1 TaxID=555088 RepID=C0GKV2_DETAL|nr:hypothetical protein [Dethiobacter alkaliphilus]EEG76034.1 hypothetical protein DealDRAFT_3111 [Dethiobacter alkaliphilus AHT 1]